MAPFLHRDSGQNRFVLRRAKLVVGSLPRSVAPTHVEQFGGTQKTADMIRAERRAKTARAGHDRVFPHPAVGGAWPSIWTRKPDRTWGR